MDEAVNGTVPLPRIERQSPAGHLAERCAATGSEQTVTLYEVPFLAQVELRVDPGEERCAARTAGEFLGCALPEPGRWTGNGRPYALWSGPGWYLIVDDTATGRGLTAGLAAAVGGEYGAQCASVVDVSAHRTVLELRGPRARDVLAHGCDLDLHPRVFGPGNYTHTLLAKATVGLQQLDAGPTYRLLVRASYADYLVNWLLDAMHEHTAVH
ncbi:sarcosine oxidase subunit gamma [Lipingzhangella halophila]|uniref:Sarcosine oxidase subunit gamma n=1 Tax=Lipingzhangella halophila TaxID=1783352 RepID=A0A7W7RIP4_9ACTN|nr:sarcosine oxidase subunit gamma family protein [Lipingzhangella halophila]MBB4932717.1 sarcosine oxidase subunit gamma [Lipingzhangella halophila]